MGRGGEAATWLLDLWHDLAILLRAQKSRLLKLRKAKMRQRESRRVKERTVRVGGGFVLALVRPSFDAFLPLLPLTIDAGWGNTILLTSLAWSGGIAPFASSGTIRALSTELFRPDAQTVEWENSQLS